MVSQCRLVEAPGENQPGALLPPTCVWISATGLLLESGSEEPRASSFCFVLVVVPGGRRVCSWEMLLAVLVHTESSLDVS